MEPILVYKRENLRTSISFSLSGNNIDLKTLKEVARRVELELRAAPVVSKVELAGFPDEEIEIAFSDHALRNYDITFQEASSAVQAANLDITGGTLKGEREEILIRARQKKYFAKDLQDILVKAMPDGRTITLKDVATIRDRWSDDPNYTEMNGNPSVEVLVQNTNEEDLIVTADYVKEYIEEFNLKNDAIKAEVIDDQSITLVQRKELLLENGAVGVILVFLLLSLFLNIRLAVWVAVGIPVSFAGMFVLASYFGISINVLSLFGMIVVVGILVDDGIVISENIYHHFEKGKSISQAAVDGTMEVFPAVFSAVFTTIVAFSSFFFLDGRLGDFFSDMSFIVIATLIISLFEGMLFLPAHIAHSKLSRKSKPNALERFTNKAIYILRDKTYEPVLRFFLQYRLIAVSIFIFFFIITIGGFMGGILKFTFFPPIGSDKIEVNLSMPAGTREHITDYWLDYIEDAAWKANELYKSEREDGKDVVVGIEKKLGPGKNKGKLNIILLDSETRNIQDFEIQNRIREIAGPIYDAENLNFGGFSPFGRPISISLLSNNLEQLRAIKQELKVTLNNYSSLKDVTDNDAEGTREINLELKQKARLLGLTTQQVLSQVRAGFFGQEVQRIQRGRDEVKIWVRLDEADRDNVFKLEEFLINTNTGASYPLRELVDFNIQRGAISINHLDGQREIKVEADMKDPNASAPEILADINQNVLPLLFEKYPDVSTTQQGQARELKKNSDSAGKVMPVIFFIMILIITFTFRSFIQTIIIFLLVPLSFAGVAWGHWFQGIPLSIFSILGIIALIGIIVNDSLVLVSKFNGFLKEGMSFEDAVHNAGVSRFRAIFLTSITTVAGLSPLILEKSFQAQFLIPMAVSIAYGIAYATFLTLFLLPVLLSFLNDGRVVLKWVWTGKKPTQEEVEPAVKEIKNEQEMDDHLSTDY
jgi:multidrug efflux pump subunit AcrB